MILSRYALKSFFFLSVPVNRTVEESDDEDEGELFKVASTPRYAASVESEEDEASKDPISQRTGKLKKKKLTTARKHSSSGVLRYPAAWLGAAAHHLPAAACVLCAVGAVSGGQA